MSKEKDDFFNWAYDTRYYQARNNKVAYIIAFLSLLISLASVLSVSFLTPLKEVKPFIITVDKTTGLVDTTTTLNDLNITKEEAIDFANMALYIRLRESYIPQTYEINYRRAVMMSAGAARTQLTELYAPDKPKSPILLYGDNANISIDFKNDMAYQTSNILISRFVATIIHENEVKKEHYIATITFSYSTNAQLSLGSRLNNPLGFIVTNYQVSKESI